MLPGSKEEEERYNRVPDFTKENITETARQMFPGCSVIWGKGYNGKPKATILLYGEGESGDLCPFHIQGGNIMQIAKTLVTIFGCCQHVVMQRLSEGMQKTEADKKATIILPGQENDDVQKD